MTQHSKILNLLKDHQWICTSFMYRDYIADPRSRLAELKKTHDLESRWCQSHNHEGQMKEWRLKDEPMQSELIPKSSKQIPLPAYMNPNF